MVIHQRQLYTIICLIRHTKGQLFSRTCLIWHIKGLRKLVGLYTV